MAANNGRESRTAPDTEELARQIRQIQADVAALAETMKAIGIDRIESASEAVGDAVNQASEALHGSTANARRRGEDLASEMKDAVTRNPLRAILVAFGVGYLIARLTGR